MNSDLCRQCDLRRVYGNCQIICGQANEVRGWAQENDHVANDAWISHLDVSRHGISLLQNAACWHNDLHR